MLRMHVCMSTGPISGNSEPQRMGGDARQPRRPGLCAEMPPQAAKLRKEGVTAAFRDVTYPLGLFDHRASVGRGIAQRRFGLRPHERGVAPPRCGGVPGRCLTTALGGAALPSDVATASARLGRTQSARMSCAQRFARMRRAARTAVSVRVLPVMRRMSALSGAVWVMAVRTSLATAARPPTMMTWPGR